MLKNAADFSSNSSFESINRPWFSTHRDFKIMKVAPTSDSAGNDHLEIGIVEGSQDGKNRQSLEKQKSQPDLNNEEVIVIFSLRTIEQLWFVQLRQTESHHAGRQVMVVGALEVFGLLFKSHIRLVSEGDGIVVFESRQCGDRVHENSIVIASNCITRWDAGRALSNSDDTSWFSEDVSDQRICYGFKMQRVKPTHYFLRKDPETKNPDERMVEVLGDGSSRRELGRRQDGNNAGIDDKFPVSWADYVRAVRPRQTGRN
jgi:hypothetical protein